MIVVNLAIFVGGLSGGNRMLACVDLSVCVFSRLLYVRASPCETYVCQITLLFQDDYLFCTTALCSGYMCVCVHMYVHVCMHKNSKLG